MEAYICFATLHTVCRNNIIVSANCTSLNWFIQTKFKYKILPDLRNSLLILLFVSEWIISFTIIESEEKQNVPLESENFDISFVYCKNANGGVDFVDCWLLQSIMTVVKIVIQNVLKI